MQQTDFLHPDFTHHVLLAAGLNLHAVVNIADLPPEIYRLLAEACTDLADYRQAIVIGHGGQALWRAVEPRVANKNDTDPIDNFVIETLQGFFAAHMPNLRYQIVYPGPAPGSGFVPLQRLGDYAGWHHDSPFKVGINETWGSWFAYRAVVLADSNLAFSEPLRGESPCQACDDKPCITVCPAQAMIEQTLDLQRCIDYRRQDQSLCADRCIARLACPVAPEHRYSIEQVKYHYGRSMRVLVNSSRTTNF